MKNNYLRWSFPALSAALLLVSLNTGCREHEKTNAAQVTHAHARYHCPMHPNYTSDKPGICPICSMTLVLSDPEESAPSSGEVNINTAQQKIMDVTTIAAEKRPIGREVRASARIAHDPELYAAVKEYQAIANEETLSGTRRALELRLKQMGLSSAQLAQAAKPDFDPSNYLIGSSAHTVWAYIDLYDMDAPFAKAGNRVTLEAPALAGRVLKGRVLSLDPVINADTRTVRARCEIQNEGGVLKPGMYLTAVIQGEQRTVLAVPSAAILRTGARSLVYVETTAGNYTPREIMTGTEGDQWTEILSGLKAGERVVARANFLMDAESRLRETAHEH